MSEPLEVPDLESMTGDQLKTWILSLNEEQQSEWFMSHDLSVLLRKLPMERSPGPVELVGPMPDSDRLARAAFRIEPETLEWLGRAAGRDREGKSGIVRRALAEYRERHPEIAA